MQLNASSRAKLKRVHPDLMLVVERAAEITDTDFIVTCGIRTLEEQKRLKAAGASKTLRSRHLPGKVNGWSHAVDLAPVIGGKVRWDWPPFHRLAKAMFQAAKELKVPLTWGGNWDSKYTAKLAKFADGPHFQLPWDRYPG